MLQYSSCCWGCCSWTCSSASGSSGWPSCRTGGEVQPQRQTGSEALQGPHSPLLPAQVRPTLPGPGFPAPRSQCTHPDAGASPLKGPVLEHSAQARSTQRSFCFGRKSSQNTFILSCPRKESTKCTASKASRQPGENLLWKGRAPGPPPGVRASAPPSRQTTWSFGFLSCPVPLLT